MKIKNIFIGVLVVGTLLSPKALATTYFDVPENHWAAAVISEAADAGIMQGRGNGIFGLGDKIKRSEFASMLVKMMKLDKSTSTISLFEDIKSDDWFFYDVNTLAEYNIYNDNTYRPNDYITRREMAVMLVKALGYETLAKDEINTIFSDVVEDEGYISLAYNLGILRGKSDTIFDPEGYALREEGATMMMRIFNKYNSKLKEVHGFYAISSWGQRDIAAQMDNVSFGWSRLQYTDDGEVLLNQTKNGGNDWYVPNGYEDAIELMRSNDVKINLAVTMTDNEDSKEILLNKNNRLEAINQLIKASKEFDGITIDFEGMKGEELKNSFNSFLKELREKLGNKQLYVMVHPVLKNSSNYYDAYDYKTIGEYADRIILMAHDYSANRIPENLLNTNFIATPVTPFNEVYTALKYITDPIFGVPDINKIQLAISTASTTAWNTLDKKIIDSVSIHPSIETVQKRLSQIDTEIMYSQEYKNPYAWYITDDEQQILLWYEDSRSIKDKIKLSKMFGVNSISVWRIGAIPDGASKLYMNVWDTIIAE